MDVLSFSPEPSATGTERKGLYGFVNKLGEIMAMDVTLFVVMERGCVEERVQCAVNPVEFFKSRKPNGSASNDALGVLATV
jgi:hypothetical protein